MQEDKVTQEIDLQEVFGVDLSGHPEIKERFGQACLDYQIERTKKGIDVNGNRFEGYDPDYVDSLEFKAWGKSKNKVNMTLRGEMLGLLDLVDTSGNKIKYGWEDNVQAAKAYNHNTGDTVKQRQFFGLTQKQIEHIAQDFIEDVKNIKEQISEGDQATLKLIAIFAAVKEQEQAQRNNNLLDFFFGESWER